MYMDLGFRVFFLNLKLSQHKDVFIFIYNQMNWGGKGG